MVHGYRHRYHLRKGDIVSRREAAHLILEVFCRVGLPWWREAKPLKGWEGSHG